MRLIVASRQRFTPQKHLTFPSRHNLKEKATEPQVWGFGTPALSSVRQLILEKEPSLHQSRQSDHLNEQTAFERHARSVLAKSRIRPLADSN